MPTLELPVEDENGNIRWEPPPPDYEMKEADEDDGKEAGQQHMAAVANRVLNPYMKPKATPTPTPTDNDDYEEAEEEREDDSIMEKLSELKGWLADKTFAGYKSAIGAYNTMAVYKGYPLLHDLTYEHLSGRVKGVPGFAEMAQKLCIHLMNYKIDKPGKRKGKHLKPGSQAQYFSGVKTVLSKKYPKLPYFQNLTRYNDLYKRLKIRSRVAAIKRGESPKDKTLGIHRDLVENINKELIRQNRYADRCTVNTLRNVMGRASESSVWTWEATLWNGLQEQLEEDWRETKTSKNGFMTMHPDALSFLLDMIHSLGAYIITADGMFDNMRERECDDGVSFVFPELADLADGGAAAKVTRILKSLVGIVDGLTEDHAAHGLRVGPADDIVFHRAFNIVAAIARGNWDFSGECCIFEYWTMKLFVAMAGKTLCEQQGL